MSVVTLRGIVLRILLTCGLIFLPLSSCMKMPLTCLEQKPFLILYRSNVFHEHVECQLVEVLQISFRVSTEQAVNPIHKLHCSLMANSATISDLCSVVPDLAP